jgi:V/A-type H+/Na+-transporting ATPase subunit E
MEDKIALLTQQLYKDGVQKAQDEADTIISNAKSEAIKIINQANKDADEIIKKTIQQTEELKKNTEAEIKNSGNQAIILVKQAIADSLTLSIADQVIQETLSHQDIQIKLINYAIDYMLKSKMDEKIQITLPTEIDDAFFQLIEKSIHEHFHSSVNIQLSSKIDSGFRIGPVSKNYLISFTDDDFIRFFKQLLRPKTAKILFSDDHKG